MVFSGGTAFLKTILNLQLRTWVSLMKLFFLMCKHIRPKSFLSLFILKWQNSTFDKTITRNVLTLIIRIIFSQSMF